MEAELGGLQVTDLTAGMVHTHILEFGSMSAHDTDSHLLDQTIPAHMYQVSFCVLTQPLPACLMTLVDLVLLDKLSLQVIFLHKYKA